MFDFPRFSILMLIFVLFSGSKLFDDDKYNPHATYVMHTFLFKFFKING